MWAIQKLHKENKYKQENVTQIKHEYERLSVKIYADIAHNNFILSVLWIDDTLKQ